MFYFLNQMQNGMTLSIEMLMLHLNLGFHTPKTFGPDPILYLDKAMLS